MTILQFCVGNDAIWCSQYREGMKSLRHHKNTHYRKLCILISIISVIFAILSSSIKIVTGK
jgi:hypothetical protein